MTTKYISSSIRTRSATTTAAGRSRKGIVPVTTTQVITAGVNRSRPIVITLDTVTESSTTPVRTRSVIFSTSSAFSVASIASYRHRGPTLEINSITAMASAIYRRRNIASAMPQPTSIICDVTAARGLVQFAYYDLTTGQIKGTGSARSMTHVIPPISNPSNFGAVKVASGTTMDTHYINTGTQAVTAKPPNSVSFAATTVASTGTIAVTGVENNAQIIIKPDSIGGLGSLYLVNHGTGTHTFGATIPGIYNITIKQPTKETVTQAITVT